ncbi:condensation domain-containing protein, partial [Pseudoalteromonas sp. BMB]|uniref:condensation domain-containing protein n=1 Tax=Pseudoalteromonas sp. BMB TaxID=1874619 RepID=UPI001112F058
MSRVRSHFGVEVALKGLFERPTVAGLAALISSAAQQEIPKIVAVPRVTEDGTAVTGFPLSYAQERLWFIDQLEPGSANYNIPKAVSIHGALEVSQLEQAFNEIVARHENLRTIFPSQDGTAQQVVLSEQAFRLT